MNEHGIQLDMDDFIEEFEIIVTNILQPDESEDIYRITFSDFMDVHTNLSGNATVYSIIDWYFEGPTNELVKTCTSVSLNNNFNHFFDETTTLRDIGFNEGEECVLQFSE
ncbi:hypothetical protein COEREDRAFT_87697 [Coemansia reversa NRRL 1564]|uniref:Ubiquitin-like domain-containing protein n=1 Tax=Coemansia reversa (strain ATCC 12441 / NRRL 1564) TaxID=763665 RepID=A0A2G5B9P7_COERN|nr:hypothetical protein COEREDRAFT_87697 [Coemansia reversa NRRL 1564]|eukprot:PIA15738.1 hypothetical protein COEREDRAFT_87697 [Coemansia reversa NRRL 1564]